jgi:hypothetical protein
MGLELGLEIGELKIWSHQTYTELLTNNSLSVTNMARYWGQGVAGYGNDLKDKVGAGGGRIAVAGNPLGLAGQGSGKAQAPGQKSVGGPARSAGQGSAANPLGI